MDLHLYSHLHDIFNILRHYYNQNYPIKKHSISNKFWMISPVTLQDGTISMHPFSDSLIKKVYNLNDILQVGYLISKCNF